MEVCVLVLQSVLPGFGVTVVGHTPGRAVLDAEIIDLQKKLDIYFPLKFQVILWFAILTAPSCRGTTSFAIHISTLVVFGYSGTGARIAIFFVCCPDTTIFCRISNKTENTKMSYEIYIFNPCLFVLHTIYIGMYIF